MEQEILKRLDKRIDVVDGKVDKLAILAIENREEIKKMVTKEEFDKKFRQSLDGQDKMIDILQRLDQERIFTIEWIKRIETDIERNKEEIGKIKLHLKIA